MLRLILFWVFGSAVCAAVFHVNVWLFAIPLALLLLYGYGVRGLKANCPACGKGIKIGHDTCHHCSWSSS